jgi:hypothetical protein
MTELEVLAEDAADAEEGQERGDDARAERARSAVGVEVAVLEAVFVKRHIVIPEAARDEHHEEQEQPRSAQDCIDEHVAQDLGPWPTSAMCVRRQATGARPMCLP